MIFKETEIFDPESDKYRVAKNIKKQAYTMPDKHGVERSHEGVEFIVVGRSREWVKWVPLKQFKIHNPKLISEI